MVIGQKVLIKTATTVEKPTVVVVLSFFYTNFILALYNVRKYNKSVII